MEGFSATQSTFVTIVTLAAGVHGPLSHLDRICRRVRSTVQHAVGESHAKGATRHEGSLTRVEVVRRDLSFREKSGATKPPVKCTFHLHPEHIKLYFAMRSLENARESWQELQNYLTLSDLKQGVRLDGRSSVASAGCRSACWKAFLIFESVDSSTWLKTLSSSRSAYNSLKTHFMRHLENPDELAANYDPLTDSADVSGLIAFQSGRKEGLTLAET